MIKLFLLSHVLMAFSFGDKPPLIVPGMTAEECEAVRSRLLTVEKVCQFSSESCAIPDGVYENAECIDADKK